MNKWSQKYEILYEDNYKTFLHIMYAILLKLNNYKHDNVAEFEHYIW
jgi:hypothetical protein